MRKVTVDEILSLGAYEQVRDRFRQRIIAHKRVRRVFVGPEMSLVFEDHDTVLMQVQEMLRAERISAPKAVREEVDVYNDLVPDDGALLGTLMLEIEDAAVREQRRRDYFGLDACVRFEVGPHAVTATLDAAGLFEDRIAAVRYVTFALPPDARALLLDLAQPARVVVDHPRYQAAVTLTEAARRSLADDLDPENSDAAARARR
jgi:hypothetical protein